MNKGEYDVHDDVSIGMSLSFFDHTWFPIWNWTISPIFQCVRYYWPPVSVPPVVLLMSDVPPWNDANWCEVSRCLCLIGWPSYPLTHSLSELSLCQRLSESRFVPSNMLTLSHWLTLSGIIWLYEMNIETYLKILHECTNGNYTE